MKDRSAAAAAGESTAVLKERYLRDGIVAGEDLRRDDNNLAAWLSGPFDSERVAPDSDLHLAVLVRSGTGSYYQHQIPPFSAVGRRLEIAFLPLEYLSGILEQGYANWVDVFELHKLRDVQVLFDRDGVLSAIRSRLGQARPKRLFIGAEIERLRSDLALAERYLCRAREEEAVLSARRVIAGSIMIELVISRGTVSSKTSTLYRSLVDGFEPRMAGAFEQAHGLAGLNEEDAGRLLAGAEKLVRLAFGGRIAGDGAG